MVGGGGSLCRWLAVVAGDSGAVGRKREGTENGKEQKTGNGTQGNAESGDVRVVATRKKTWGRL